jgi:hypothetical protein
MPIADLGNILAGNSPEDSYFVFGKSRFSFRLTKENYSNRHWWIPGLDFCAI